MGTIHQIVTAQVKLDFEAATDLPMVNTNGRQMDMTNFTHISDDG